MISTAVSPFVTSVSAVAVFLNLLLLPLIAFKSGRDIGSYKMLLFLYTSAAIVYATVTMIMVPIFEPSDKGWLFYAAVQRVPQYFGSCLLVTFSTCYIILLLTVTYSFLYRYFVMCAPKQLSWFHRTDKLIAIIILYISVVFLCMGYGVPFMFMNKDLAKALERDEDFRIDLNTTSFAGAPIFKNGRLVSGCLMILVTWTMVIVASTSICTFCVIKIMIAFRTTTAVMASSVKFKKLQIRLFVLLILQTAVPLIFTFIPALISYVLAYLGIHEAGISQISSALMPVAQVIDPILIFGLVTEYRRALINAIRRNIMGLSIYSSSVSVGTNNQQCFTNPQSF